MSLPDNVDKSAAGKASAAAHKQIRENTKHLDVKDISKQTWTAFLNQVANGARREAAAQHCRITRATLRLYLATQSGAMEQLKVAETTRLRRDWPLERVEDILVEVAIGKTLKEALKEQPILDEEREQLHRLLIKDPEYREMYEAARKMQAIAWADEIIELSKDNSNDVVKDHHGGDKPNTAAVARHKLITDNLRWIMARTHWDQWGDRIQQDITGNLNVNLPDILAAARRRSEKAALETSKGTEMLDPSVIEGQATEVRH